MSENKINNNKNNILKNIKSKYILEGILNNLVDERLLSIIKYNKYIQNKIDKDKNYYKNYFQIEIDIIPVKDEYGKFINIFHKESFYHIYLNNNEKEINRNYITKNDYAEKIKIIIDYKFKSLTGLFKECECIKKINYVLKK